MPATPGCTITDYSLRQLGSDGIPGGTVQSHVVRPGDTLQTIAQIYFGSPAYWYLIADANGLSGSERLAEGVTLTIPNKVANSANSAQTFKVYNESEVIGSTSPEIRTVAKKKKWYQTLIMILIIVILVVAAVFTAGAALGAAGVILPGAVGGVLGAGVTVGAGLSAISVIALGAAVYAGASIITQGLAVAAGLQESFSWKAVGKAAVTGAVSAGAAYFGGSLVKGMELGSFGAVATNVSVEAGKQIILDGKISNVAALVGAAASAGAFKELGESGSSLRAAGDLATQYGRTFGAGLSLLENAARGRSTNALNWVSLATSAIFDAGDRQQSAAAGPGAQGNQGEYYQGMGSQYFDRAGNVNWTNVAVQAVGTVVISNQLGSDAAINYFGNVAADALVAGYANGDLQTKRELAAGASWAASSQAGFDQAVEAFSNPGPVDRSGDVQLAAGPGYSGMGGTGGKSQREQNIERMMRMANEPGAMGSTSPFRVEINGTSTTTSADAAAPGIQFDATTGQWGYDQGNGTWTFPLEDRRVQVQALPINGESASGASGFFADGRSSVNSYWNGVQDEAVANGSPLTYLAAGGMKALGNVGYSIAEMATAVAQNPGEALIGARNGLVNFGPEGFNAATNLAKTSLNGFSLLAETSVAPSGYFSDFRQTDAFNITPLLQNENQAQAGGSLLVQLATGAALTKYGGYGVELNTGAPGVLSANPLPVRLVAPSAVAEGTAILRPVDSSNYSIIGEFQLKPGTLAASDANHFRQGNRQLYESMQSDPAFAAKLEAQNPGISAHVTPGPRGGFADTAPPRLTWHHDAYSPGNLQLMPRVQHQSPGPIQNTLHPNQQGGRQIWGGGRN